MEKQRCQVRAMKPPRKPYSIRTDLKKTAVLILSIVWIEFLPTWILLFHDLLPPKFSLELTDAGNTSLDKSTPVAPIPTAFKITLHAINRRRGARCYSHGEAAVLHSGFTVAWGRAPRFCVGGLDARAVTFVAWADGVELPRLLGDSMAAERRRAGSVELEVDVRLFRDDGTARPTLMRCDVMIGGDEPPNAIPCTLFALQNWASDIAPNWMQ